MPPHLTVTALATVAALAPAMCAEAAITQAKVERQGADALAIRWTSAHAVSVYETNAAGTIPRRARPLDRAERSGVFLREHAGQNRRYFVLIDQEDRQAQVVAERLVPLNQGSNFRDVGGYVGAGGKHVRWGLIYRSAGQPMLSSADQAQIRALGLTQLVDLRSNEERVVAPSSIMGIPYTAVGYSAAEMMPPGMTTLKNGPALYRRFPELLAPQVRIIFAHLLRRSGPIAYNCSAGQDRTGFATAVILSALGVPRDQILADYHLSTAYRRPQFEMPKVDAALRDNAVAALYAAGQKNPRTLTPQPLKDADGRPYLDAAFQEIDARWGSMDGYLLREIKLTPGDIAALRRLYLQ